MKATLTLNGIEKSYPEEISDLENLLLFVMEKEKEDIVVEVKVDEETFSEAYHHQAKEISLADVRTIEIVMHSKEEFARNFMKQASEYIEHLKNGFKSAIRLLRSTEQEEDGYDMLARSLDMLRAFKSHSDNAKEVLERSDETAGLTSFWERFNIMADKINEAQKDMDHILIADLLEEEMLPFLEEWKGRK